MVRHIFKIVSAPLFVFSLFPLLLLSLRINGISQRRKNLPQSELILSEGLSTEFLKTTLAIPLLLLIMLETTSEMVSNYLSNWLGSLMLFLT